MAFLPVCISTRTWIFTSAVFLHFLATVCFGVHLFWCVCNALLKESFGTVDVTNLVNFVNTSLTKVRLWLLRNTLLNRSKYFRQQRMPVELVIGELDIYFIGLSIQWLIKRDWHSLNTNLKKIPFNYIRGLTVKWKMCWHNKQLCTRVQTDCIMFAQCLPKFCYTTCVYAQLSKGAYSYDYEH